MTTRDEPVADVDVERAMRDLEQRVRQRRRLIGAPGEGGEARDDMRNVADNWFISAHLPITWSTPVVGRALALAKRATRLLLRWYINPIVDQQNDFNAAVARAFVQVAAQQEAITEAVSQLESRVQALEEQRSEQAVGKRAGRAVSTEARAATPEPAATETASPARTRRAASRKTTAAADQTPSTAAPTRPKRAPRREAGPA